MTLLKKIIGRSQNNKQKADRETADHYQQLRSLQKNHDWISVTHTRSQRVYQSMVLDIDVENHELLIDELYPAEQTDDVQSGDSLQVTSRSRQQSISFFTRVLAREFKDGAPFFRLELPEEIGRHASRGAFRVYVENEADLFLDIDIDENRYQQDIRIVSLSADGIKISFPELMGEELVAGRKLSPCWLRLPTGYDVECVIELRNVYPMRSPHRFYLAGGSLSVANPQQRVRLDQYIAAVQRKQRRREQRTEN